jgi:hypothetical protein
MLSRTKRAVCFSAAAFLAASLPFAAQAKNNERQRGVGFIANPLVDQKIDEPLHKAENVFDVYRVIVDWLSQTYPEGGEADKAIRAFGNLVKQYENVSDAEATPDRKGRVRTIEMPMSMDQFLRVLRSEAPGAGAAINAKVKSNTKAQIFTAALLPFLQCRGITFRVRPLAERSFWIHSALVNFLRATRHELSVNAPKNAMAVFEFLTYPMAQKGRTPIQFHKASELQDWVENNLIPTYDVSISMMEKALASMGNGTFESVDMTTFLMAPNPFPDEGMETAHRTFGKAEVEGMVAALYGTRAGLRSFCTYDIDDFGKATDQISDFLFKKYLREKVPFGKKPRIGSPSSVRYQAFEKYGSLFTLRNGSYGSLILADLRKAWGHYEKAMQGFFAASPSASDERVVRLRWVQAGQKEFLNKVAPQIRAVLAGPATITDYVGGETVDIDVPGFLQALPQDLKDFFPEQFNESTPYRVFRFSTGKLIYSNYDYGNPTGWKLGAANDTWKKIFPNMGDDRGPEGGWIAPMHTYRVISRTYLGAIFGPAMGSVMN